MPLSKPTRDARQFGITPFGPHFESPEVEARFRADRAPVDRRGAIFGSVLIGVSNLFFVPRSFALFPEGSQLWLMLALHLGILVASLALAFSLHCFKPRQADTVIFAWFGIFALLNLAIELSRPVGYLHLSTTDLCIIVALYLVIPNRWGLQVAAAVMYTLGHMTVLAVYNFASSYDTVFYNAQVLVIANIGCGYIAWLNQLSRRSQFHLWENEQQLSEQLREALSEVRTLKGLLPICASCKSVRTDERSWQELEAYVAEHTDAQFTHGLCPECAAGRYGDYLTDDDLQLA